MKIPSPIHLKMIPSSLLMVNKGFGSDWGSDIFKKRVFGEAFDLRIFKGT